MLLVLLIQQGNLIAGGYTPTYMDRIEYITIATLGDAVDFGNLTANGTATDKAGLSSPTRALFAGGEGPSYVSQIDYVTIATQEMQQILVT